MKSRFFGPSAFLIVCALALRTVTFAADSIFVPASPIGGPAPNEPPLFRFDHSAFGGAAARSAGVRTVEGLPIPGLEERSFRIVAPNNSLTSLGTKVEIVEDGGSRFVDMPEVHQLLAESETHPGDRVGLYEIGGEYHGTALVDGVLHELVRGDWSAGEYGLYRFAELDPADAPAPGWCATETSPEAAAAQIAAEAAAGELATDGPRVARVAAVADREVDIAIECSFDHVSKFADVDAATHNILAIMAEVSNIYIRDVQVQFRISNMRMWNTPADPYDGANGGDYLLDLMNILAGFTPPPALMNADLVHLFTADMNYGGVAIVDTACAGFTKVGFSDVTSSDQYPNPGYTWSVDVTAHELGHNLGSNHTHCYSPPIDICWGGETGCYVGNFARSEGTIMSYCHISAMTRLEFHPRVITVLRNRVMSAFCLANVPTSPVDIYEEDDTFEAAAPLGEQNPQTHSIHPAGDVDWVTLNLTQWAGVTVTTEGASGDTVMTLYNATMGELMSNDDIGGGNLFSRIETTCAEMPLSPGRYYLRIEAKGGASVIPEYKISVALDYCFEDAYEPDDTFAEAATIELGTMQEHSILPVGDRDVFKFTLTSPTTFVARLEVPQYTWYLMFLYDSNFVQIDDGNGDANTCTFSRNCSSAPTPAGTYYIKVMPTLATTLGNYKIRLYPCTPKVGVKSGDAAIADGAGPVDFGYVQPGFAPISRTFRVENHGMSPLTLSGLSVPAGFTVTEGLAASIPSAGYDLFTIEMPADTPGTYSGAVSFTTNDPGVPQFDFTVTGEVAAPAPEVAVSLGTTEIASGGPAVDFGRMAIGDPAPSRVFRVRNLGSQPLFTGSLAASGGFEITEPLNAVIPASWSVSETQSVSPAMPFGGTGSILIPVEFTTVGPVTDVKVTINITTPWTAALSIYLRHPDGTFVLLTSNLGGQGDNFTETTFWDLAPTSITTSSPPFTGTFRPMGSLSTLNGKNIAGSWTLVFNDPLTSVEPKVIDNFSITVRSEVVGQDTFTVQLPTGTSGDFNETVSFSTNDADESVFSIPVKGFVGEVPTLSTFTAAAAQSANPVPFSFTEGGAFPATSIEVSESSDFAMFQSFPAPGGPYAYTFASSLAGARTLYARLRNATGVGNVRAVNTILDNQAPVAAIEWSYSYQIGGTFGYNPYTTSDAHSSVKEVDVWVRPPGGSWEYVFTQNPPTGSFAYSPQDGAGVYLLDIVARDAAGNSTPAPVGFTHKRVASYNPVPNGPFPHHFPSPINGSLFFPMENSNGLEITFGAPPTSGVLTVQRFEDNVNAAGLDPAALIGQRWSITGSGGFVPAWATMTFRYEPTLMNGIDAATELNWAYRVTGTTHEAYSGTVQTSLNWFTVQGPTDTADWYLGKAMPASGVGEWTMY